MKPKSLVLCVAAVVMLAALPAYAGPGGAVARVMFETPMGRVLGVILVILFLPLIIYVWIKQKLAERRARRDLAFMAQRSPLFDWFAINDRALDCFTRIHAAWGREDVSEVT